MKHMRDSGPPTTRFHPQLTWLPPEPIKPGERYMRGGITELVSEPVSPLFETLGLPAFEQAIKEHQQRLGLGPAMQGWGFTTINGYVYGRVRISFKMMWEAICHLPQLLGQAALVSEMADAWERETLPAYRQAVDALRGDAAGFLAGELLGRMEALALVCARYWAVFAAMAPQLDRAERRFETFYRWLRRRGDPEAPVFL